MSWEELGYDSYLNRSIQSGLQFMSSFDFSNSIGGISNISITSTVITGSKMQTSTGVGDGSTTSAGILIDETGFYACANSQTLANANVKILANGTATFTGTVTATAGVIGGWNINSTSIYTGTEDHSEYTANAGDLTIYSDGYDASIHAKNFYIDTAGILNCASAVIQGQITTGVGSSISTDYLSGTIAQANLNVADRGWTQTSAFSVTDADTIAWGSGTLTSADGTAYSIGAGNTGNMTLKTYIYLDTAVSTTAYQITTTAATAVGVGKVLVAIAQNGTVEATYFVFNGQGGLNIDAASIVASSITGNEIAASTITSGKLNVSQLSTITADLGTITAGTITILNTGWIKGGQTAYNTGTGFFLGYDTDAYKFSLGNVNNYLNYDGANISLYSNLANAITLDYGSSILLKEGGNINLTSVIKPTAPTVTLVSTSSGYVDNGDHKYVITYITTQIGFGNTETNFGTASNTVTVDSTHKQVDLTNIPVSSSSAVIKRNIYRTKVGSVYNYYLLDTLNDNTTTTYRDNTPDIGLTGGAFTYKINNSSGKINIDDISFIGFGYNGAIPSQIEMYKSLLIQNNDFGDYFKVNIDKILSDDTPYIYFNSTSSYAPSIYLQSNGTTKISIVDDTLKTDIIGETTSANGVIIDGLNIKDSKLNTDDSVVTTNIKDSNVTSRKIAFTIAKDYIEDVDVTRNTTSYADITNLTKDVVCSVNSIIEVVLTARGWKGTSGYGAVCINVGGTDITFSTGNGSEGYIETSVGVFTTAHAMVPVNAGTITVKGRLKSGDTNTLHIIDAYLQIKVYSQ